MSDCLSVRHSVCLTLSLSFSLFLSLFFLSLSFSLSVVLSLSFFLSLSLCWKPSFQTSWYKEWQRGRWFCHENEEGSSKKRKKLYIFKFPLPFLGIQIYSARILKVLRIRICFTEGNLFFHIPPSLHTFFRNFFTAPLVKQKTL